MGCILWDVFGSHFAFFKKKVGICFYFWIIRVVISQLACRVLSDLTPLTLPWHPPNVPKHPQMTITDFNYESPYLTSLTCHMDVWVHIGRLTGRSIPLPIEASSGQEWQFETSIVTAHIGRSAADLPLQDFTAMHHGMYIMGCIWQPFCILQEKVGICFYFWIIRVVISQLAL